MIAEMNRRDDRRDHRRDHCQAAGSHRSHLSRPLAHSLAAASLTSTSLGMYAAGVATATAGLAILGRSSADEGDEALEELPGVMEVWPRPPPRSRRYHAEITPRSRRDHVEITPRSRTVASAPYPPETHPRPRAALHSRAVHPKKRSTTGPSHSCARRRALVGRAPCHTCRPAPCGRAGCDVAIRSWRWASGSVMRYSRPRCAETSV